MNKIEKIKNEIPTVISVKENKLGILRVNDVDYISLTGLVKYQMCLIHLDNKKLDVK